MARDETKASQKPSEARIADLEAELARLKAEAAGQANEKTQRAGEISAAHIGHRMAQLRQIDAMASESFIRGILDANADCSKVLDLEGRIEISNAGSLRALEVDSALELVGHHWADFWPQAARVLIDAAMTSAIAGRSSRFSAFRPTRKSTPKWWDVVVNPIIDDHGTVTRILVISRDITELHRIQTEAADANGQLKAQLEQALLDRETVTQALGQGEKLQAVGQLVGGVAHDFNNLLQVISGGAALLKTASLTQVRRNKLLDGIITAAQHARTLTDRLLTFSHRDAPRMATFDVNTRLSSMVELLERTLASGIAVQTELAGNVCPVEAEISQFEIALLNLAVNARDAMPTGGTLTIHTSLAKHANGSFACIRITDTGQGMAPEIKTRIFEPYYTTKGAGKGTGLGLPQVIDFIKISGGHIEVESEEGQGSSFLLYLPCKEDAGSG